MTRYISNSIQNHLKPLYRGNIEAAKPELVVDGVGILSPDKAPTSPSTYLLVPNLNVFRAHADSSPYTTGLPAITALVGFADRLRRNIMSRFQVDIGPIQVAWILRSLQSLDGIKRHEPARWNDNTKMPMADVVSRKFCNLSFDLIIQCNSQATTLADHTALLPECLPTSFASGSISTAEEAPTDTREPEAFRVFSSVPELFTALMAEQVPRWFVIDYSSKFKRKSDSILNDLSQEFLCYKNTKTTSCLSLSGVGYKLLEVPKERLGSRAKQHANGETLVGVQEIRQVSDIPYEAIQTLPIFWSYKKHGHLLLCQGSPPLLPIPNVGILK